MTAIRFTFLDFSARPDLPRPQRSIVIPEEQVEVWEIHSPTLRSKPWWCPHVGRITAARIVRAGPDVWLLDSARWTDDGAHFSREGRAVIRITAAEASQMFEAEGLPLPSDLWPIPLAIDPTATAATPDLPDGSDRPAPTEPTVRPSIGSPDPADGPTPLPLGTEAAGPAGNRSEWNPDLLTRTLERLAGCGRQAEIVRYLWEREGDGREARISQVTKDLYRPGTIEATARRLSERTRDNLELKRCPLRLSIGANSVRLQIATKTCE